MCSKESRDGLRDDSIGLKLTAALSTLWFMFILYSLNLNLNFEKNYHHRFSFNYIVLKRGILELILQLVQEIPHNKGYSYIHTVHLLPVII